MTFSHSAVTCAVACALFVGTMTPAHAAEKTLKVYLLAGQSNMQGHGYGYEASKLASDTTTTLEYLLDPSIESQAYVQNLIAQGSHDVLSHVDQSWYTPRDDVFAVHYNSKSTGGPSDARPTSDPSTWTNEIAPLSPGFGLVGNGLFGWFGPELGMGHRLGDASEDPVFLLKSARGGTQLADGWRSPSTVAARGGDLGVDFTNTVGHIKKTFDQFDQEIADGTFAGKYDGATGYEVAGFYWLQGWNETHDDVDPGGPTLEQAIAEYEANLIDLVKDLRASDARIASDLPVIIMESADQDDRLNTARAAAVAQLNLLNPGSAVFIEHDLTDGENGHFHFKAEAYLQMGWMAGDAVIANGYGIAQGQSVPEPGSLIAGVIVCAAVVIFWGRRSRAAKISPS